MPIPGPGEEKSLGKIRKELEGDGYSGAPNTDETRLNDAADGDYGEINTASEEHPNPVNPDSMEEFASYDHSSTADVYGCMDQTANNYNPNANVPDDCTYTSGCTDQSACNYNPAAVQDNGTCTFANDLFPSGLYDCDGNCLDDSDGDGVCDELEISGCTNSNAVAGTYSILGAAGAVGSTHTGNYNPNATNNTGCVMNYLACTDPGAVDYDSWGELPAALDTGGILDIPGVSQVIVTDNTLCDYTVPTPYPPDNPPYWTGDTTVLSHSGASTPMIYNYTGTDPIGPIGQTTGLTLTDIIYGGGPGNIASGATSFYLNQYENSFIRGVSVFAVNYDANGWPSTWNSSTQWADFQADKGAYRLYSDGTYYNQNGVDLYEMIDEHGGNISISIRMRPFRSSLAAASTVSYYGSPPNAGVYWNTSPLYSGDDPYYFRQAYLRLEFDDIDFSDGGANAFDPQSYGTCYPSCDPPIYFSGCIDMLNPGDGSDEDHFDCPNGPNIMHLQVRQRWHHTPAPEPDPEDGPDEVAGMFNDMAIAPMTISDRTLKENIELVGKSPSGINIYEFDYIDKSFGQGRYRGVMAQEVPQASTVGPNGKLKVFYNMLDVNFERIK
jgi:hypothetical protein